MKITTIGLDIAKRFFHVVCCNDQGRLVSKKMLKRAQVLAFFILNKGVNNIRKNIPLMLDDETKSLSGTFKTILRQLQTQLKVLDSCIEAYGKLIVETVKTNDICLRVQTIPGFGPMVSSAYFNEVGNGANYRRGRDVSAFLGIVPRQHSSGSKYR